MQQRALRGLLALAAALGAVEARAQWRGRVVLDGRPAGGVSVAARPLESGLEEARREARGLEPPAALASTTTAADGSFALSVPGAARAAASPGLVRLWLAGPGARPMALERALAADENVDLGEIALERAQDLSGQVFDAHGKPVAGAHVTLRAPSASPDGLCAAVAALTDKTGQFAFSTAAASGNRLTVEAAGLAAVELAAAAGRRAAPLRLRAGRALHVLVQRRSPRVAAAGALVRFEGSATSRWVETDAAGRARLESLPAQGGRLVAWAADGAATLTLRGAEATPVALVLAPMGTLHGRVVDATRGTPLPGRRVLAKGEEKSFASLVGPDGRYEITGLPAGRYDVRVDDARSAPYRRSGLLVGAGASLAHDVALAPAGRVQVRVVDERGRPIGGARGHVVPASDAERFGFDTSFERQAASSSAPDGTLSIERLAAGARVRLFVKHERFMTAIVEVVTAAAGGTGAPLEVVLRPGRILQGRVRDAQARPIAGARVRLRPANTNVIRFADVWGGAHALLEQPKTTDAAGRFEFSGLTPGAYAVRVEAEGHATTEVEGVDLETPSASPLEVVLASGGALRGVVLDGSGVPVVDRRVFARGATSEEADAGAGLLRVAWAEEPTDANGAWSIAGLEAGRAYDLSLSPLGTPLVTGVLAPAEGVELHVPRAGRIAGVVLDADSGRPLGDFAVAYLWSLRRPRDPAQFGSGPSGPGRFQDVQAEDGRFALDDVAPGIWDVEVRAPGYQATRIADVTVEEDRQAAELEIRLMRGAALAGRVVAAAGGQPLVDVAVYAQPADGAAWGPRFAFARGVPSARSDADGRFRIEGLAPGALRLSTSHPDWASTWLDVSLTEAGRDGLELRLKRGASVAGAVVAGGQPVAGASVALSPVGEQQGGSGAESAAEADAAGRFRFEHLEAGEYALSAQDQSRAADPLILTLRADEVREGLRLELRAGATLRVRLLGLEPEEASGAHVMASTGLWSAGAERAANGLYVVAGAPAGDVQVAAFISAPRAGVRTVGTHVTVPESLGVVEVEIDFEGGLRLDGRVTRAGAPVAGVMINAVGNATGAMPHASTASSDAGGAFALTGLRAGTYTLHVYAPSGAHLQRRVELTASQSIELELPGGRQAGVVVDADSERPLQDVLVRARLADEGAESVAQTDGAGRFVLDELSAGPLELLLSRPGYVSQSLTFTPSETDELRVALRRAAP